MPVSLEHDSALQTCLFLSQQAELWDVDVATELYSTKPIEFETVREGVIKVYDGHTKVITVPLNNKKQFFSQSQMKIIGVHFH